MDPTPLGFPNEPRSREGGLFSHVHALGEHFPFYWMVGVAYLLILFAQAVAILIGLIFLSRGQATMASGVFVGLLVILGLRVISSTLNSINVG